MATEETNAEERQEEGTMNQATMTHATASEPVSYEQALQDWESEMADVFEADRAAEQLGAEDLAIRINARA